MTTEPMLASARPLPSVLSRHRHSHFCREVAPQRDRERESKRERERGTEETKSSKRGKPVENCLGKHVKGKTLQSESYQVMVL